MSAIVTGYALHHCTVASLLAVYLSDAWAPHETPLHWFMLGGIVGAVFVGSMLILLPGSRRPQLACRHLHFMSDQSAVARVPAVCV